MSRSRTAFLSGTITDNPLAVGGTTMNSAGLASLPAIATPDIAVLVIDPTGSAGAPEVVYVTAHTGAATSATIARGKEGSSAREHASGIAWVHGPTLYDFKGWRLEGENTGEQTTTSTSATDLVTISGLLIPASQYIQITGNFRKTTGASADVSLGLKLNSTVVVEAVITAGLIRSALSGNEAGSGNFTITITPRVTNYLKGIRSEFACNGTVQNTQNGEGPLSLVTDMPTADITSIAIRGLVGSASITLGVSNVQVMVRDA